MPGDFVFAPRSILPSTGVCHPAEGATAALLQALRQSKERDVRRFRFKRGEYHFWPHRACERHLFVSNNDDGLKRIIFPLEQFNDLEIDGDGSTFVFHGDVVPFVISGCRNLRLSNLVIDWSRTFHSEGRVIDAREGEVVVEFPPRFPFTVAHQRLIFTGDDSATYEVGNILEFDAERRETAFQVLDNFGAGQTLFAEDLGNRRVRLAMAFTPPPAIGNILVFQAVSRHCPAVVVSDSDTVALRDLTIRHSGGMGIIAQFSRDLALERIRVLPSADNIVSLTADATHFVNCAGTISINDCMFHNQMDDATNVHGIYGQISDRVTEHVLNVRTMHHQQHGIDVARPGDHVELVRSDTLGGYHRGVVRSTVRENKQYTRLTFVDPLPQDVRRGDAIGNLSWQPDVTIRGCDSRGNRARGFLISTAGRVLIERNTFHVPGAAILIAGDANFWFESGPVRDVTIRDNTFDRCNYGVWGRACIDINPEIASPEKSKSRYHRNIIVQGNHFHVFDRRVVRAHSVDGFVFQENRISYSSDYPPQHETAKPLCLEHCNNTRSDAPDLCAALQSGEPVLPAAPATIGINCPGSTRLATCI